MILNRMRLMAFSASLVAACTVASTAAVAQTWPDRPITIVVPFAAGSGSDIGARLLAKDLQTALKQTVIVDNKPGANGALGTAAAARAKPDGYTLLIGSATTNAANFAFSQAPLSYAPDSFDMVSPLATTPVLLWVNKGDAAGNVQALLAAARKDVGKLSCGSGNAVTQVACEVFKKNAGIFAVTIPYRSNPQALQDLIGGQVNFAFSDPGAALPLLDGGRIRPLAVAAAARVPAFKDVPTIAEGGVKDVDMTAWTAIFVPKGTPRPVVEQLNTLIKAHLESDALRNLLGRIGGQAHWLSVDDSARFANQEVKKWARYVKLSGVKPE